MNPYFAGEGLSKGEMGDNISFLSLAKVKWNPEQRPHQQLSEGNQSIFGLGNQFNPS
jgi:hypothetical protein